MILKRFIAVALFFSALTGIAQENQCSNKTQDLQLQTEKIAALSYNKRKFLFGTLSIVPGGGISVRNRNNSTGTALDAKIGIMPFGGFDSARYTLLPMPSIDCNFLYYTRKKETSPYLSGGVGCTLLVIPYIPLRAGVEFKNGFVDIGAKMVYGFIPSPEIRGGFKINF